MIVLLLLIQMFLGISGVIQALLLRNLVNHAVEANYNAFVSVAVILVGFILVQIAANAVVRFLEEYTKSTVENRLKHELFRNILVKYYGAVTATVIAEALAKLGFEIERKRIEIPGLAIKSVGNYHATVKLYEAATAEVKVTVKAQETNEAKAAPKAEKAAEAPAEEKAE